MSSPVATKDQLRTWAKAPKLDDDSMQQTVSGDLALLQPSEFDLKSVRSVRPVSARPIPKAILVGVMLSPIFLLSLFFTKGIPLPKAKPGVVPNSANNLHQSNADATTKEDRLRQQLADANARIAVLSQKPPQSTPRPKTMPKSPTLVAASYNEPNPHERVFPSSTASVVHRQPPSKVHEENPSQFTVRPRVSPVVSPRRRFIYARRASQPLRQKAIPHSTPTPVAAVKVATPVVPASLVPVDALERWHSLALVGNYGSLAPQSKEMTKDLPESSPTEADLQEERPLAEAEKTSQLAQTRQLPPTVNPELEAPVLQERRQPRRSLAAGTQAQAFLVTPVYWDGTKDQDDYFTIVLSSPLLAADGTIVFPSRTQLVTKLRSLSEAGIVRLVAMTALVQHGGQLRELALPEGAIQVRGREGKPLIAKQLPDKNRQRNGGGLDLGRLARIALQQAGNQLDGSVENIVEAGTPSLIGERHRRNIPSVQSLRESPSIRFLPSGTGVEVFVNRSFSIPIQALEEYHSELLHFPMGTYSLSAFTRFYPNAFSFLTLEIDLSRAALLPGQNLLRTAIPFS